MLCMQKTLVLWHSFQKREQDSCVIWELANHHSIHGYSFKDLRPCHCEWNATSKTRKPLRNFSKTIPRSVGSLMQAWKAIPTMNVPRDICQKDRARCLASVSKADAKQVQSLLTALNFSAMLQTWVMQSHLLFIRPA